MKLSNLFCGTDVVLGSDIAMLDVTGIAYDSREVRPGFVFIAVDGVNTTGEKYAAEAECRGACIYVGSRSINGLHIPQLLSSNPRRTLAYAYANFYDNPQKKMKIVGITGTNGKTSTAFMLRTVLAHGGYKTGLIGTVKCMIGDEDYIPRLSGRASDNFVTMTTPDPDVLYMVMCDMAERGVEVLVMETSSHALAFEKLAPIEFELGIFTNLTCEHLDFHGDMESYLLAKSKLFRQSKKGIFNYDDTYSKRLCEMCDCVKIGFGIRTKSNYIADSIYKKGVDGSEYILRSCNARFKVKTTIPGEFNVYNTLAATAAARELNIDLVTIQNALYSMNGICGRLERVKLGFNGGGISVFIDYAHTPYALENLLKCVAEFRAEGQRIVTLFGCGGDRDRKKRSEMGLIATKMSDFVIITSDNPRSEEPSAIIDDIIADIPNASNYTIIEDRREAIEYAIENSVAGDIILLVGKGHEQYEINKDGIQPFSEAEIAENAAERLG